MEGNAVETAAARAAALIDRDRHAAAIPILEHALADAPEDDELLDLLATAQLEVDPQAALATTRKLAAADPEGERAPLIASFACDRLGDRRAAVEHARRAVAAAPWLALAHAQLAQTLVGRRGRRLKEARREAQAAIELAPDDPVGYVAAGNVELGRGRSRRAQWVVLLLAVVVAVARD